MMANLHCLACACCLVMIAQADETAPQAACPSLMQLSHGANIAQSCEDSDATRDSIAPLPNDCIIFGKRCGIQWDYKTSWPCWLDTWASMKEGFINCCLAGWHTNTTCESLADEAFASHDDTSFPAGAGRAFCAEMRSLEEAHRSWSKDKGNSLIQVDQKSKQQQLRVIVETMAQRILAAREKAALMFQHFAAGAVLLAGGISSQKAALALISSALTRHLAGCDPNAAGL
eukprot:TRINITY_DN10254_c0_g1_i1.p1 TRINITY_DN10254_c0_g1~~TRINITY_DN10254_c0_g1_i1.p1  ORF type:complete len:255 (-),score=39.02 TRINITY_DN10254_c0_g1_i1:117-806(-)